MIALDTASGYYTQRGTLLPALFTTTALIEVHPHGSLFYKADTASDPILATSYTMLAWLRPTTTTYGLLSYPLAASGAKQTSSQASLAASLSIGALFKHGDTVFYAGTYGSRCRLILPYNAKTLTRNNNAFYMETNCDTYFKQATQIAMEPAEQYLVAAYYDPATTTTQWRTQQHQDRMWLLKWKPDLSKFDGCSDSSVIMAYTVITSIKLWQIAPSI